MCGIIRKYNFSKSQTLMLWFKVGFWDSRAWNGFVLVIQFSVFKPLSPQFCFSMSAKDFHLVASFIFLKIGRKNTQILTISSEHWPAFMEETVSKKVTSNYDPITVTLNFTFLSESPHFQQSIKESNLHWIFTIRWICVC